MLDDMVFEVADCIQAEIGYTENVMTNASTVVADCIQAEIGYTALAYGEDIPHAARNVRLSNS